MKFNINHDYHLHSMLSLCSGDKEQTKENLLKYAESNGLGEICITDHFWDETVEGASEWYKPQDWEHISEILPLPQTEYVKFYFGCETDLDKYLTLGISDKRMEQLDFVIIPTTHLHMTGFTIEEEDVSVDKRAKVYIERLRGLLSMDLPFHKIGIAHLTCQLIAPNWQKDWDEHIKIIDAIPDEVFEELFSKIAEKGAGIELNFTPADYSSDELPRILRPYKIAKKVGCKFYLGSDAHHPEELSNAMKRFQDMVDLLELTEENRLCFGRK